jgi:hypothetical protein
MAGQKPAAAEKKESANPVLNQSILVVTLVLTGEISTPEGLIKEYPGRRRPPSLRERENARPFESFWGGDTSRLGIRRGDRHGYA